MALPLVGIATRAIGHGIRIIRNTRDARPTRDYRKAGEFKRPDAPPEIFTPQTRTGVERYTDPRAEIGKITNKKVQEAAQRLTKRYGKENPLGKATELIEKGTAHYNTIRDHKLLLAGLRRQMVRELSQQRSKGLGKDIGEFVDSAVNLNRMVSRLGSAQGRRSTVTSVVRQGLRQVFRLDTFGGELQGEQAYDVAEGSVQWNQQVDQLRDSPRRTGPEPAPEDPAEGVDDLDLKNYEDGDEFAGRWSSDDYDRLLSRINATDVDDVESAQQIFRRTPERVAAKMDTQLRINLRRSVRGVGYPPDMEQAILDRINAMAPAELANWVRDNKNLLEPVFEESDGNGGQGGRNVMKNAELKLTARRLLDSLGFSSTALQEDVDTYTNSGRPNYED